MFTPTTRQKFAGNQHVSQLFAPSPKRPAQQRASTSLDLVAVGGGRAVGGGALKRVAVDRDGRSDPSQRRRGGPQDGTDDYENDVALQVSDHDLDIETPELVEPPQHVAPPMATRKKPANPFSSYSSPGVPSSTPSSSQAAPAVSTPLRERGGNSGWQDRTPKSTEHGYMSSDGRASIAHAVSGGGSGIRALLPAAYQSRHVPGKSFLGSRIPSRIYSGSRGASGPGLQKGQQNISMLFRSQGGFAPPLSLTRLQSSDDSVSPALSHSGFRNIGNTCYLNAVLATLVHTTCFRDSVVSKGLEQHVVAARSVAAKAKASTHGTTAGTHAAYCSGAHGGGGCAPFPRRSRKPGQAFLVCLNFLFQLAFCP